MIHIIVNEKASSGRGRKTWHEIRKELLVHEIPFRMYPTRYRGSARESAKLLTREENWNPEDILLVVGGDGTLNEVVDGICHLSQVKIGYLPTGSGNDFARGCGIPKDPIEALSAVLSGKEKKMDVGMARMKDGSTRRFLISMGIGFDAGVCHEALASRIKDTLNRVHLGKLTYGLIAIRQLFSIEPFTLEITGKNGETRIYPKVLLAVAMNLPYEGGGFRFCPEADGTDGLLDVMIVSNLAKWKASYLLPLARKGLHTRFPEITMEKCCFTSWETDRMEPVHLDGESGGRRNRVQIGIESEPLCLLGNWEEE